LGLRDGQPVLLPVNGGSVPLRVEPDVTVPAGVILAPASRIGRTGILEGLPVALPMEVGDGAVSA